MSAIVEDTTTENEQLPPFGLPPGMNAPAGTVKLVAPTTAVIEVTDGRVAAAPLLKHCTDVLSGLATTMLAGKVSVNMALVNMGTKLGLFKVTVSVLVPMLDEAEVGLNDLLTVGTAGWSMQLPVSP
jgi:hypothetical protein